MTSLTGASNHFAGGEVAEIGVGMLGYAFMGKAHSNAFRKIAYMTWPPPFRPRLVSIAGRNEEAVRAHPPRERGVTGPTPSSPASPAGPPFLSRAGPRRGLPW